MAKYIFFECKEEDIEKCLDQQSEKLANEDNRIGRTGSGRRNKRSRKRRGGQARKEVQR